MEHNKKFEYLADKYAKEYITKETLKGWVTLNEKKPGKGITREEYEQITGEVYSEEE